MGGIAVVSRVLAPMGASERVGRSQAALCFARCGRGVSAGAEKSRECTAGREQRRSRDTRPIERGALRSIGARSGLRDWS